MSRKMLIDAAHAEETRVVVVENNRIQEFDFESRAKKQIRGNIYLARVTRVEPSLQAAFVEYGGNRHGFLSFNEVHPDYYQIPHEDQQALLEEERQLLHETGGELGGVDADPADADDSEPPTAEGDAGEDASAQPSGEADGDDDDEALSEFARRRRNLLRRYKIQEVIRRRQILLVQVVKEERGNKGAALTTYISLAGRYSVLMPNTARGGGISRKITSATDRKRLKKIATDLEVPEGMGLIIRTAGAKRTKAEIKRDHDYLMRLWETIRAQTLESIAPCLIHEESNLVKRAIRDLYDKDIDQVLVDGDPAYREAKDFIRMLMPSHAKKVQPYREQTPLFLAAGVERQLDQIHQTTVTLRSGGYLVINQTEALVAVDVNSGRSTRERNIEATALKTNLEAADEVCRQFRLRDLAGLIVIDFIDMDDSKNNRAVEKRMRDALKRDRARIQTSKISAFGLMEVSRQRRRASLLEGSYTPCPHCAGRGLVRSPESSALHILREIEATALSSKAAVLTVRAAPAAALYLLNEKRDDVNALAARHGLEVIIRPADGLIPPDCEISGEGEREVDAAASAGLPPAPVIDDEQPAADEVEADADGGDGEGGERRKRRRRRRRRGGRGEEDAVAETAETEARESGEADDAAAGETVAAHAETETDGDSDGEDRPRRRRRGRRGGRGRRAGTEATAEAGATPPGLEVIDPEAEAAIAAAPEPDADADETPALVEPAPEPVAAAGEAPLVEAAHDDDPAAEPEPAPQAAVEEPVVAAQAAPEPIIVASTEIEEAPAETLEPAAAAPLAPPEPTPEDVERRKRWQDRIKFWQAS